MPHIPDNVRQVLVQLLPANILNDVICYVFYDNHPRDEKKIDITVYTKTGEVREYFQRDLISSVNLESTTKTEIKLLRNSVCELFYLLAGGDEIVILSRRDKLQIHQKISHVSSYKISDVACSGQAVLKVVTKFDQILVADDNFKHFKQEDFSPSMAPVMYDTIITHLMRKLTEAKFTVKSNENTLKEFVNIRQTVAYSIYKKIHPNLDDSVFKDGSNKMASALQISTQKPWIKSCNKKIVLVYNICNLNDEPLEEIQILLHGTTRQSIEYTTKIFEKTNSAPFWNKTNAQTLPPNKESAIVLVIDYEELKDNVISRLEFNGVLTYKMSDQECVLPIEDVNFSSWDTMGEQFDVMCSEPIDTNIGLAILATTEKTDLILRHIKKPDEHYLTFDMFCKYLKMEKVPDADNIVVHRLSPYHVLNGVMIIRNAEKEQRLGQLEIAVYSRSSSQVLALLHYIQDVVPYTVVITTPSQKIVAKDPTMSTYNEDVEDDTEQVPNYIKYATSMLNRTGLVLEYLDNSMIHMSESKNTVVRDKIGSEIDLFAQGETSYIEFKEKMREEAAKGVEMLENSGKLDHVGDVMCVE